MGFFKKLFNSFKNIPEEELERKFQEGYEAAKKELQAKKMEELEKNDLLVLFSDTPPMFSGKRRIHFEDTIDIYFISRI